MNNMVKLNSVDKEYCRLLKKILDYGRYKNTRAGETISLFGDSMRFDLQEGLPLLTTKKVFYKGIIHELLWFLKGDTNIKYLVENGVHIWDDDAYRYYLELINKHNNICQERDSFDTHDINYYFNESISMYPYASEGEKNDNNICDNICDYLTDLDHTGSKIVKIEPLSKEDFINKVKTGEVISLFKDKEYYPDNQICCVIFDYTYGDLGPVYGKQWRCFGKSGYDQIQKIIDTLKNNPDDRRMLCVAFNPDVLNEVALPPCHVLFQFYTYELNQIERLDWLCRTYGYKYNEWKYVSHEKLDELGVPRRTLSCSFYMRSNDFCCGNPYNIAQYAMLTYMLCEVCNMVPGELIYNGGDIHVYTNHVKGAMEQLSREGSKKIPQLKFARKISNIDDFTYDDFIIENYFPEAPIKYTLNVGL